MKLATRRRAVTRQPSEIVLRVELLGITPSIWRRLAVHSELTLADLHHVLQAAMGWHDRHSHEFQIDSVRYRPEPDTEDPVDLDIRLSARKRLRTVAQETDLFIYRYDFGDQWRHRIVVEHVGAKPPTRLAWVLAGEGACPPEDCGGIPGYLTALAALGAPTSAAAREFLAWTGEDFDPNRFDRQAANAALERLRWNRWTGAGCRLP